MTQLVCLEYNAQYMHHYQECVLHNLYRCHCISFLTILSALLMKKGSNAPKIFYEYKVICALNQYLIIIMSMLNLQDTVDLDEEIGR